LWINVCPPTANHWRRVALQRLKNVVPPQKLTRFSRKGWRKMIYANAAAAATNRLIDKSLSILIFTIFTISIKYVMICNIYSYK
jgi:hypothetical protein